MSSRRPHLILATLLGLLLAGDVAAQAASSSLKGPAPKAAAPAAKAPAAKAAPAQAPTQLTESLKKVATRYARTEERINLLVGRRQKPEPLPASLPNPFYRGVESSELATLAEKPVEEAPAAPDISDADTLARVAPTLRLGGLVVRNQQPHLTINSAICKAGDVIPVPGKDKDSPIFIQVRKITPDALTLGLNDAELTLPLKR